MKVLLIKVLKIRAHNEEIIKKRCFSKTTELICEPAEDMELNLGEKNGKFYIHHIIQNLATEQVELYQYINISRHDINNFFDKTCARLIARGWEERK